MVLKKEFKSGITIQTIEALDSFVPLKWFLIPKAYYTKHHTFFLVGVFPGLTSIKHVVRLWENKLPSKIQELQVCQFEAMHANIFTNFSNIPFQLSAPGSARMLANKSKTGIIGRNFGLSQWFLNIWKAWQIIEILCVLFQQIHQWFLNLLITVCPRKKRGVLDIFLSSKWTLGYTSFAFL